LIVVGYSLFDFIFHLVQAKASYEEAVSQELLVFNPIGKIINPFLLLVASIGFWLNKRWGCVIIAIAGALLFYRAADTLQVIAFVHIPEISTWSSEALRYWWLYAGAKWDIPRLVLVTVMLILAIRTLIYQASQNNESTSCQ